MPAELLTLNGIIAGVYRITTGTLKNPTEFVFDFRSRTMWREATLELPDEIVHNFHNIDSAVVGQKLVFSASVVQIGFVTVHVESTILSIHILEAPEEPDLNELPVKVNGLWFKKISDGMWNVMGTNAKVTEDELFGDKNVEVSKTRAWELELFNINRTLD